MSYEFEHITYAEMISDARESLDFGTKQEIEELELEEYFLFSDDNYLAYDDNYISPDYEDSSDEDEDDFDTNTIESREFFDGESFNFDFYDEDDEEIF